MTPCRSGLHDMDEPMPSGLTGRRADGTGCRRCHNLVKDRYKTTSAGLLTETRYASSPARRGAQDRYKHTAKGILTNMRHERLRAR